MEVVLQRRARDKEPCARVEDADDLAEHRVDVLDAMRLVDDDVLPRELLERTLLAQAELVRRDQDVEVLRENLVLDDDGLRVQRQRVRFQLGNSGTYPLLLAAAEHDDVEAGDPLLELAVPVVERALRHNDEVRALDALEELEVAEERDRLQRLAESLWAQVRQFNVVAGWSAARTISSARMPLMPL